MGIRDVLLRIFAPGTAEREALAAFDPDAAVAMHVARHKARGGGREVVSTHDLLYGLLQTERFAAACERAGGDAEALADRVLTPLGDTLATTTSATWQVLGEEDVQLREFMAARGGDGVLVVSRASTVAQSRGRLISCTDLWAYLSRTEAGYLLAQAGVDPTTVLFLLAHGIAEQDLSRSTADVVHVVLRNDDYTRTELVVRVLREVFALAEDTAVERMRAAEAEDRSIVGRFELAAAREKVTLARALARKHGAPLWVGIEDT